MDIKLKYITRAAYIWIYSAVIIFLIGFLKWFIALPASAAAVFGLVLVFKNQSEEKLHISLKVLISGAVIVLIWMALCGQGGFFGQGMDWNGRNAQLGDLVSYSWPVYYSDGSAFTYYIGHFLLPALFGKIFGLGGARAMLMIYTSFGVYIIWLLMIKILKANSAPKQLLVLALFIFFGNSEDLRIIMLNFLTGILHINLQGAVQYGFTTNFNLFAWTFNQTTCAFLILALFFDDDARIENFIFMGAPIILFSPFMMCTAIIIFAAGTVKEFIASKKDVKGFIKRLFSIQNLCALLPLLLIITYLCGNVFSPKPESLSFHTVSHKGQFLGYIGFLLFEFIILSACMYPRFKKNVYFHAANAILIILPFFKMGLYNDLVTRGCASALFALMLCAGDYLLNEPNEASKRIRKLLICLILITVAVPCASSCLNSIKNVSQEIASGNYHKKWLTDFQTLDKLSTRVSGDDLKYNFYTFDAKEHFFFKYMTRN